jgi:hypothetical protein
MCALRSCVLSHDLKGSLAYNRALSEANLENFDHRFRQRGVAQQLLSLSSGSAILYTESRTGFNK